MEEDRWRLQIVRQDAAVDGGYLLAQAVGGTIGGEFPACYIDLVFQVFGFFHPGWGESVVPQQAMRHTEGRVFVGVLFQV
jgi:hypothetical protein